MSTDTVSVKEKRKLVRSCDERERNFDSGIERVSGRGTEVRVATVR